jgi:HSP20 family protein
MMLAKRDLFDDWFDALPSLFDRRPWTYVPAFDVTEDADAVTVVAELPGMAEKDVKVTIEDGVLTVSGEKKAEAEHEGRHVHRVERRYGSFSRSFSVPERVDIGAIKARCKDGLLTITMPKRPEAQPKRVDVKVE